MKLLVTHDGSTASAAALGPAERLALKLGAEIILLRIHDARDKRSHASSADAVALEAQWKQALEAAASAMKCPARAEVQRLVKQPSIADTIIDAAVQYEASLIMMATRGENEFRHAFIGSTALSVTARSPVPVVLIRSGAASPPPKSASDAPLRLLATYDGSNASRAALAPAGSIACAAKGEAILVWIDQPIHVEVSLEPDPEKRERARARIEAAMTAELNGLAATMPCRSRAIVRPLTNERWSTVDEIRAIAAEEHADLICMATRGHSGVRHLLFGSTALDMVGRSDVPVMLVRSA